MLPRHCSKDRFLVESAVPVSAQEWSDYLFPLSLPPAYADALPNR